MQLPQYLYSALQTRELDVCAINEHNIPSKTLMLRAASACFDVLKRWQPIGSIAIFCGPGNNGGDGYVLARLCKEKNIQVTLYAVGGDSKTPDSQQAKKNWLQMGGQVENYSSQFITEDVIVDAMLGSGSKGEISVEYAHVVEAINATNKPVLSVDIPTGLHADTGVKNGVAVKANATVCFIGLKTGLVQNEGYDLCGEIIFDSLGVPAKVYETCKPILERVEFMNQLAKMPSLKVNGHKGTRGHVAVIGGGEPAFCGAVALASEAALRAGCGLSSCVVPEKALPLMARLSQEVMCHVAKNFESIKNILERVQVIVFGPGLGQNAWSQYFFDAFRNMPYTKVVDADALNLLAQKPVPMPNAILTPHPREAARLLGTTTDAIQADRIAAVKQIQAKFGGVVVLKGAGTLIATQSECFIHAMAVPALSTAGTGDVLSGIIGGLLAQGLNAKDAALLGVSVHAQAGLIEQSKGARGMLASDLMLHVRSLLNPAIRGENEYST